MILVCLGDISRCFFNSLRTTCVSKMRATQHVRKVSRRSCGNGRSWILVRVKQDQEMGAGEPVE